MGSAACTLLIPRDVAGTDARAAARVTDAQTIDGPWRCCPAERN
jgi:hypothetical protein